MHLCAMLSSFSSPYFFFFNDTATTEIYTLSLHDALPISNLVKGATGQVVDAEALGGAATHTTVSAVAHYRAKRSEEHTSELQSQSNLVCRLLLEKKKKNQKYTTRI